MKRLGANEAALRRLIETGITIGAISEELFCVEQEDIGPALWEDLNARGFDRCGVKVDGRVTGYVESPAPGVSTAEVQAIAVDQLVAETAPVWQAMPRLAESRSLFVLTPSGPTGVVTVADLSKQPARLLMFGVISLLEMTMLEVIRREHPDDSWRGLLSDGRIDKAEALLAQRQDKGQDIDLADCLQWSDKATICAKTHRVMSSWGFASKGACERLFKDVQDLRDQLAHAQHPAPDGDWCRVVQWLREADRLITSNMDMLTESEVTYAR